MCSMEQVVSAAAAEGPGAAAKQRLQQALMLAERYRLSSWALQMRYTETLLLRTHLDKDISEAIEASDTLSAAEIMMQLSC